MKPDKFNLSEGSIIDKLLFIALPIMGTQFMQMAYNLINMFWLGRVGSEEVAASGTAGMYLWLAMGFALFGRMGAEIGVSQNVGRGDRNEAMKYSETAILMAMVLGTIFAAAMIIFKEPLIGYFNIREESVRLMSENYLMVVSLGIPLSFAVFAVTGSFNAAGNAKVPFLINSVGLVLNIVLDPLLIFVLDYGIQGAAWATVISQSVVFALSMYAIRYAKQRPFDHFRIFTMVYIARIKQIITWASPICVESLLFTFLSMIISRHIADWGADALAVSRVGSQIESLSWLICGGFATAVTAFVGQNYGAKKWGRIHRCFNLSLLSMGVWGVLVTLTMYFGAEPLFAAFLPEESVVALGGDYMRILATAQLFMCIEFTVAGSFRGMGKTLPPSIASVVSNAIRVGIVYYLSSTDLGLNGIWWGITIGCYMRGVWILVWYLLHIRKIPKEDEVIVNV